VLANAWDAASARMLEEAGAPAIATTSAGMAWALGYPDGQRAPRDEIVAAIARICRVVRVPVSADVERGFGDSPAQVGETVRAILRAGAIGVNLEDGKAAAGRTLVPPDVLADKIRAARQIARDESVPLFVNARVDTYFVPAPDPAARLKDTLARAARYVDAGADGVFVPGLVDLAEIGELVRAVPCPVNILVWPGAPTVPALAAVGVRRVSVGCSPMQAVLGLTRRIGRELLSAGTYDAMDGDAISVADANVLFASR